MNRENSLHVEKVVKETIKNYSLFGNEDRIIVALSGGKDSTSVAYILKKLGYNVFGLYIDLNIKGYSERCLNAVRIFCEKQKIELNVYDMKNDFGCSMCYLRTNVQEKVKVNNCAVCGVVKKWILNKKARELKADKIVTGHNLDDETQTALMNFFKGNPDLSINSLPITGIVKNRMFVPRIKPLFFVDENKVREYSKLKNLDVVYERCPCAGDSYRIKTRRFVNSLTEKQKLNIIKNNIKIIEKRRKNIEKKQLKYCKVCSEPSRNSICRRCEYLGKAF